MRPDQFHFSKYPFPVSMGYFVEWSEYLSNLLFAYVPLHKEILLLFAVKL